MWTHAALKWLFSLNDLPGKYSRWVALQGCSPNIVHRTGKVHANADEYPNTDSSQEEGDDIDFYPVVGPDFDFVQPSQKAFRPFQSPSKP